MLLSGINANPNQVILFLPTCSSWRRGRLCVTESTHIPSSPISLLSDLPKTYTIEFTSFREISDAAADWCRSQLSHYPLSYYSCTDIQWPEIRPVQTTHQFGTRVANLIIIWVVLELPNLRVTSVVQFRDMRTLIQWPFIYQSQAE